MEIVLTLLVLGLLFAIVKYSAVAAFAVASLLAFGTIGFWGIVVIATIVLFIFIEQENGFGATATLVAFFALHQMFGDIKVFSYIFTYPLFFAKMLTVYFGAGTLWSIAKWWFHVHAKREEYEEKKAKHFKDRKSWGKTDEFEMKKEWARSAPAKPSVSDSKDKIIQWMTFWPWSMVWTILNDPIKKLFKMIYRRIAGVLEKIADKAWAGTEGDYEKN